jgi:hypothetical protein
VVKRLKTGNRKPHDLSNYNTRLMDVVNSDNCSATFHTFLCILGKDILLFSGVAKENVMCKTEPKGKKSVSKMPLKHFI